MRSGNFAAAWKISDAVLQHRLSHREDCSRWPRHLQWLWDGRPLTGKRVLVRCYHGLGDTIQFVRLLAPLRIQAREVTAWVQPCLIDLLRGVRGIDRLLPLHDGTPEGDYDADIELMEVAHALRLTPEQIPPVPYLHVRPAAPLPAGARNVGIIWRSGSWAAQRSLPPCALAPLAQLPGVRWYSLQYPPLTPPFAATDLACRSIAQMAARMLRLDLVISVDTMAAHLAGALAIPTWTLLHHDCDWRWMHERSTTPWYPTMRLFRQRAAGQWQPVVEEVAAALAAAALAPSSQSSTAPS